MTTSAGELFVRVRPDVDKFGRELNTEVEKAGRSAGQLLTDAISVGAVVGGFAKITSAASDLEQAIGGTEAVFGEASDTIEEFAEGADEAAGLSKRAARELTSQIGGLLKGFGFTQEEAAATSVSLAQLGADLSATFGGNPEEAVQALGAALRGEFDPLERYGVSLNVTAANLKAVELGLADSTNEVDLNARAQASLALIYERSADAVGQYGRESDTAAGAATTAAAKAENAAADLGENFLPIYTKVAEAVGTVAEAFGNLPDGVQTALIVLGSAAVVAGPVARTYRDVADAVGRTKESFQDANSPTRRYASSLGKIGGAAVGVFAAVEAIGLLADVVNEGRFGSATDDLDRTADSAARLAEGELIGAIAEDIDGLAGAFRTLDEENLVDVADKMTGLDDVIPFLGDAANYVEGELENLAYGTNEATDAIDRVDQAIAAVAREQGPEAARTAIQTLKDELGRLGITGEQVDARLDETAGVLRDLESGAFGAAEGLSEAEGAVAGLDTDFKDLASAIGDAKKEFEALDDAVFGQKDAQLGLEDAQIGEQEAALDLTDARREYNEAIAEHGPYSQEAREASLRLQRAEIDLERAQLDVLDAQRELNQATTDQADILENQTVPGLVGYLEMLQQIRDTAPETAGGIAAVNEQLLALQEALGRQVAGSVGDLLSGASGFLQQAAFAEAFATGNRGDLYRVNGRAGG